MSEIYIVEFSQAVWCIRMGKFLSHLGRLTHAVCQNNKIRDIRSFEVFALKKGKIDEIRP